ELRIALGERGRHVFGGGGKVAGERRDAGLLVAAVGRVAVVLRTIGAVTVGAPGEMGRRQFVRGVFVRGHAILAGALAYRRLNRTGDERVHRAGGGIPGRVGGIPVGQLRIG